MKKDSAHDLVISLTGTHVQHETGKDSPRWTAYVHQYRRSFKASVQYRADWMQPGDGDNW